MTRYDRIPATYSDVLEAAREAARVSMPSDSIKTITSHARWEYRHWDPDPTRHPENEIPDEGVNRNGEDWPSQSRASAVWHGPGLLHAAGATVGRLR